MINIRKILRETGKGLTEASAFAMPTSRNVRDAIEKAAEALQGQSLPDKPSSFPPILRKFPSPLADASERIAKLRREAKMFTDDDDRTAHEIAFQLVVENVGVVLALAGNARDLSDTLNTVTSEIEDWIMTQSARYAHTEPDAVLFKRANANANEDSDPEKKGEGE